MSSEWKRLRVVVEVPVQGDYKTTDLIWDVKRAIGDFTGSKLHRKMATHADVRTGRIDVKDYNKCRTQDSNSAEKRAAKLDKVSILRNELQ